MLSFKIVNFWLSATKEHSDSLDAQLSYYDSSNINEHEDLTRANENEAAEDDSEQSRGKWTESHELILNF